MKVLKEKELFEYLKANYFPDLVMSKGKMSRWDCYSPSTRCRIELKSRGRHYNELMIEKGKYDAMISECRRHSDSPLYINSTPKGIYAFDLSLVSVNWFEKVLPKTTKWNTEQVTKVVTLLNINEAKELK